MSIRKLIIGAALAAASLITITPDVNAGTYCNPPTYSRSGVWATYSVYASGSGAHRVAVYRSGYWYYGSWKYGSGWSSITLYSPDYYGGAICQLG